MGVGEVYGGTRTGGTSSSVTRQATQTAHGFAVGDAIYQDATGTWLKGLAGTTTATNVVATVTNANTFTLTNSGFVSVDLGHAIALPLFLSQTVAGAYSTTAYGSGVNKYMGWYDPINKGIDVQIQPPVSADNPTQDTSNYTVGTIEEATHTVNYTLIGGMLEINIYIPPIPLPGTGVLAFDYLPAGIGKYFELQYISTTHVKEDLSASPRNNPFPTATFNHLVRRGTQEVISIPAVGTTYGTGFLGRHSLAMIQEGVFSDPVNTTYKAERVWPDIENTPLNISFDYNGVYGHGFNIKLFALIDPIIN